jgi:hypothetical protein
VREHSWKGGDQKSVRVRKWERAVAAWLEVSKRGACEGKAVRECEKARVARLEGRRAAEEQEGET